MTRTKPNYIAAACGAAFLLCYLFLPLVKIVVLPITGWQLMQYSGVMIIPLVLGVAMTLSALLLSVPISIGAGGVTAVATLIMLLCGNSILANGNALGQLLNTTASQFVGMNVGMMIPVSIGFGGILCIVIAIAFVVVELAMGSQKPAPSEPVENPWPTL